MGYIYKITNIVNGKVYIGQTILQPSRRWHQHELSAFNTARNDHNLPLHFAMKKYGLDNFKYEIIEECDQRDLNDREIFWIAYYDSTNPDLGYNLSLGGGGASYYKMDEILLLWEQGYSVKEISERLHIDRGFLGLRLKQEGVSQEEINLRRYISAQESRSMPVYQYSLDGLYLGEYPSVKKAREITNVGHIEKCCNGQQKQAGGYIWSYVKFESVTPAKNDNNATKKRPVYQYNLDGTLNCSYPSAYHAQKSTGIHQTAIKNVCIGRSRTAGGYIWRYYRKERIDVVLSNNTGKAKRVGKYDTETQDLIQIYESLTSAAKLNNMNPSCISSACSGRYKSSGGYTWKYI